VGVKVWIFKGEVLEKKEAPPVLPASQTRTATPAVG
jgi:ribosomal protein S3